MNSLETTLANWYSKIPSLPLSWRVWIARASWWITLILAILSAVGFFFAIAALVASFALAGVSYGVGVYHPVYAGPSILSAVLSLLAAIVSTILLFMAVAPLKAMRKRGWTLLFINGLIAVVLAVLSFLFALSIFSFIGLVWSLVFIAIEFYVLFQIRGEFVTRSANTQEAKVVQQ